MVYFASHGARMPILALLAFRRPHNVVLAVVPFALMGGLGILLAGAIRDAHAAGVVALVSVPSLLAGPALVGRLGRSREATAPLVLGSLAL
ncbi:MAG: hypothetical protein FJ034_06890, partial [Chloroflexi bacterium]|nr:hypothetical protein [Chloroflexota bacterium]